MEPYLAFLVTRMEKLAEQERRQYDEVVAAHTTTLWQRATRALQRSRRKAVTTPYYPPSEVSR